MNERIERARKEQQAMVELLESGHPDTRGIKQCIDDWFWEEMAATQMVLASEDGLKHERR